MYRVFILHFIRRSALVQKMYICIFDVDKDLNINLKKVTSKINLERGELIEKKISRRPKPLLPASIT
jgi:hypothetical protein